MHEPTRVTPARRTGSVHANRPSPGRRPQGVDARPQLGEVERLDRRLAGTMGWSVNGCSTVTLNNWVAVRVEPPVSVAVTVTVVNPGDTGLIVTRTP